MHSWKSSGDGVPVTSSRGEGSALSDAGAIAAQAERDAARAAALCGVDPLLGVLLRARAGAQREAWLARLRGLLPCALRRVPVHIADDRLLGGLDLAASLHAGRPVAQRGLLAQADGEVLLLASAERLPAATAGRICAALDHGDVAVERDGFTRRDATRFGVVALDEGVDEETVVPVLRERLAMIVTLDVPSAAGARRAGVPSDAPPEHDAAAVAAARGRLAQVTVDDATLEALAVTAAALGVDSLHVLVNAARVARAAAALGGRTAVAADDASLAARLVLAPRATALAQPVADGDAADDRADEEDAPEDATRDDAHDERTDAAPDDVTQDPAPPSDDGRGAHAADDGTRTQAAADAPLSDVVLAAAQAAIPGAVLARLAAGETRSAARAAGRAGARARSTLRGRPLAALPGVPSGGARLALMATLRAAAPWQRLRRSSPGASDAHIQIRREDLRVRRYQQRRRTTTIFAVDASGSAALHRLPEAKGAVELLLAQCYVRRDRVALIAYRGVGAELLLAPTRSLVRAKRSLAALPGGGGTPTAAGLDAAAALARALMQGGDSVAVVLLSDGRANVARDGAGGREQAERDALAAARAVRALGVAGLVIDIAPRAQAQTAALAAAMGARYVALPQAGAVAMSRAITGSLPVTAAGPARRT